MGVRIEPNAEPIPGYRLIDRLGGGGFGEVWKCEAPGGLHKAIKFVFGSLELAGNSGQRAEQELKALSRVKTVRHPYVLSLERYDILDGQLVIVMELADRNLWDRYKECRGQGLPGIPRDELLNYLEESAEALDLMNNQYQLQHLDIKPQNIFLIHNHVKVADFGLVKDLEGSQASITGGITPVYAAPETFDGKVSRFSDQYSLAIVYQELLTGQRPFSGVNVRQLIMQHLSAEPNVAPLDPSERPVIGRSLSKEPDQRFPTCRDMVRALRQASHARNGSTERHVEGAEEDADAPITPSSRHPAPQRPPGEEAAPTLREAPGQRTPPPTPTPWPAADGHQPNPGQSETHCLRGPSSAGARIEARAAREERSASSLAPRPSPLAPHEVPAQEEEPEGDGLLCPTLVIGVGGLGCTVLESFRAALVERFGTPDGPGNVRTLLIDTDPAVLRQATGLRAQ